MNYAPVVLFAYKRVDKLKFCLEALVNNMLADETELYVFSDGAKGENDIKQVEEVRFFLRNYKGNFKAINIFESPHNLGLANSIISGVTRVINLAEKVIVVEDDLITSRDFLLYMNDALVFYEKFKEYGAVSAYTYPMPILKTYEKDIYVTRKGECWGWGTWKDRWDHVDWEVKDFDEYLKNRRRRKDFESLQYGIDKMLNLQMKGKIDSWAVRWCYYLYKNQLLTVYPKKSRTINIGFDGSGTHCTNSNIYDTQIEDIINSCKFERLMVNNMIEKKAAVFEKKSIYRSIATHIGQLLNGFK